MWQLVVIILSALWQHSMTHNKTEQTNTGTHNRVYTLVRLFNSDEEYIQIVQFNIKSVKYHALKCLISIFYRTFVFIHIIFLMQFETKHITTSFALYDISQICFNI